jgi:hypothetical protein
LVFFIATLGGCGLLDASSVKKQHETTNVGNINEAQC